MGAEDPMEPRCDRSLLRLFLTRRKMKKTRITQARRASVPRTTMTAMAQWGNGVP